MTSMRTPEQANPAINRGVQFQGDPTSSEAAQATTELIEAQRVGKTVIASLSDGTFEKALHYGTSAERREIHTIDTLHTVSSIHRALDIQP